MTEQMTRDQLKGLPVEKIAALLREGRLNALIGAPVWQPPEGQWQHSGRRCPTR